jgi:molybdopterin converting factor small subunit
MDVSVQLFGPAAMAVGRERVAVRVQSGATCGDVLGAIRECEPKLRPFVAPGVGRLAVNHAFTVEDRVVLEGDELALIAMVSGG